MEGGSKLPLRNTFVSILMARTFQHCTPHILIPIREIREHIS
jgi:hypothetical protein